MTHRLRFALPTFALGLLALAAPLSPAEHPAVRVGWLLALAGCVEIVHGLRRTDTDGQRGSTGGATVTIALAILLINAPYFVAGGLSVLVAAWFAIDAVRHATRLVRRQTLNRRWTMLECAGNAAVAVGIAVAPHSLRIWIVALAGGVRIFEIAWTILTVAISDPQAADDTVVRDLGFEHEPDVVACAAAAGDAERSRAPIDRAWILAFLVTLFAIHVGRMRVSPTLLGAISPTVAVIGDMVIALIVTFLIINPLYLLWRWPTRRAERRAWAWYLTAAPDARRAWTRRTVYWLLSWRMALAVRMRATRYSIPAAISLGLARGLPVAAVIAATVPVWGMSWFFDTENYASAVWNSWAESRADTWREAMVRAVVPGTVGSTDAFTLSPAGTTGDFSFVVIGDTGEGDASQHVLHDQLLAVTAHETVKFLVISSDVVYPNGEMHDYEDKFWLPFKGVTKPVYAIPGNHDWYDALEAFSATFFEPAAARASIRARVEADLRVSSTTTARIDALIREAGRLRSEYRVPTGFQRAPFFEIQSEQFALIAVDTGVLKKIDRAQTEWLQGALARARGKFTMAILGHPFFAAGGDVTSGNEEFARLKAMLRDHGVAIVMAGDTHDLEYYEEPGPAGESPIHHFVNGGGGAYLSFGTPLAWPAAPPTPLWAHYPGKDAVVAKIDATTSWWKWPAWWWTRHLNGWPFSVEFMSAMFDVNGAPFFQSFVEVHVETSQKRVRIVPYGVHGQLTWGVLSAAAGLRPPGVSDQTPVEWIVPMATRSP
jgi:uncharacterized membrane protein HdeD (DUF308 family)